MAKLYIVEFSDPKNGNMLSGVPSLPALAQQDVTIGETFAQSDPFTVETYLVRVFAGADCAIAVGVDPDATDSTFLLASGNTEYFTVPTGMRLAVIGKTF